jgi:cytochrome P450
MGATKVFDLDVPVLEQMPLFDRDTNIEQLRAAAGVSWIARNPFGFTILHYDDAVAVLRDKRWHSATSRIMELHGVTDPTYLARRRTSILSAEGEEHTRLRRLVGKAFSPRAADRLRPFMREVVGGLVDAVAPHGRADVAVDICEPYPIPIICELLGAPKHDWKLFSRWATDVLRIFNGNLAEDLPVIMAAQDELDAYTRELIAERRSLPADDLLTDLIAAEEAGDKLSTEELLMMVEAVIVGGTDTTRNQLGCALALFAEHPQQWRLLADQPELAPQAVEEVMRYFGAVRATGRFASEEIEYRGVVFPAGTFVSPSLAGANRDRSVFERPDVFDITRPPSGQPHLTFGAGIHYCLGAALARAELQEALPLLARRLPGLALAGPITWKPNAVGIFGPEHLPVTFTPEPHPVR